MPPVRLRKYFSEKNGEAVHPLEKEAVLLGERKCNKRKPKWRKELELLEQEQQTIKDKTAQTGYHADTEDAAENTSSTPPVGTTEKNTSEKTEVKPAKGKKESFASDASKAPGRTAKPPLLYQKEGDDEETPVGYSQEEPDIYAGL